MGFWFLRTLIIVSALFSYALANLIHVPTDQPTVQDGINAAMPGDTVVLATGTYSGANVVVDKAITVASNFIFSGANADIVNTVMTGVGIGPVLSITADDAVVIGIQFSGTGIGMSTDSDCSIRNNRLINNTLGIDFTPGSKGECIDNFFRLNNGMAMRIDISDTLLVSGNTIRNNFRGMEWMGEGVGYFIDNDFRSNTEVGLVLSSEAKLEITDNIFRFNLDGIRIDLPNSGAAQSLMCQILENTFHSQSEDAIKIQDNLNPTALNWLFHLERNLIYNNGGAAIGCLVSGNITENLEAADIQETFFIVHNTFSNNQAGISGGEEMVVWNNIFIDHTVVGVKEVDGQSEIRYNLFHNNTLDHDGANIDLNRSIFADPMLGGSYNLLNGSPAIDLGLPTLVWNDETRHYDTYDDFKGNGPDLGYKESIYTYNPTQPTLDLPLDGATDVDLQADLNWTSNLDEFEVEVYECTGNISAGIELDQYELVQGPINIAGIPDDLSGITFNPETNTFFSVNNGSELIYEHDLNGNLIRTITLSGYDDTEAIVHMGGTRFAIAEEKRRKIAFIDILPATTNLTYASADLVQLPEVASDNLGLEGIGYDPIHDQLYVIKEKNPIRMFRFENPTTFDGNAWVDYPFDLADISLGLSDVSGLHHLGLSPAVEMLGVSDHILVLSHESHVVMELDAKGNLISSLSLDAGGANGTLLAQIAQAEGVCMDADGNILVMSEPNTWYKFAHPNFSTLTADKSLVYRGTASANNLTLPANVLEEGKTYCWRIRGSRFDEKSVWSDLSSFTTTFNPVLPAILNGFEGESRDCQVDLFWSFADGHKLESLVLERRSDQENEFQSLAQIQIESNGFYHYQDVIPGQINEYRLHWTDVDGQSSYSNVLNFSDVCNQIWFQAYPNPIQEGNLHVQVRLLEAQMLYIRLMDLTGREHLNQSQSLSEGIHQISISMEELAAGMYLLEVYDEHGWEKSEQIVKIK